MNATELGRKTAVISQASRESSNKECTGGDFRLLIGGRRPAVALARVCTRLSAANRTLEVASLANTQGDLDCD